MTEADLLGADGFAGLAFDAGFDAAFADCGAFLSLDMAGLFGALLMRVPVVFVSTLETA
jgi:hypothetical protein